MGICACHGPEYTGKKKRRFIKLKSSQTLKQLHADKNLQDVIEDIFNNFDKNKDGFLDANETKEFVKHSFIRTSEIEKKKMVK